MSDHLKLLVIEHLENIILPRPSCERYKCHPDYVPKDHSKPKKKSFKGGEENVFKPNIVDINNFEFKAGCIYII
jgi:hypothetical protein